MALNFGKSRRDAIGTVTAAVTSAAGRVMAVAVTALVVAFVALAVALFRRPVSA